MSWPVAAARSHRPAPRGPPVSLPQHPEPTAGFGASQVLPATHPGKGPACCHPCLMGRHVQGTLWPCIFMGRAPASLHLFWEDFSEQGAGQFGCKAPREGAPLCPPTAPLPLPSQRGGTPAPCPGRAAPGVTFGGRPSPGTCHHGSKGRLMGGFYYSQFCRGILPLFIMAFPPGTGGEHRARLEQALFALTSQGVFSEQWYLVLNPFLHFPAAACCILLEEGGRALSWGCQCHSRLL